MYGVCACADGAIACGVGGHDIVVARSEAVEEDFEAECWTARACDVCGSNIDGLAVEG